ncbi:MAG: sulfatase-like hydrolase/transferase [Pseudomonadales bacterium]
MQGSLYNGEQATGKRYTLRCLFTYTLISSVSLALVCFFFLFQLAPPEQPIAWLYLVSIPSYYYILLLLCTLLVAPLVYVPYLRYLAIVPKIVFDILMIGDVFVFNLYRFHVDSVFLQMVIFDFKGMGFSTFILSLSAIGTLLMLVLNVLLFRAAQRWKTFPSVKLHLSVLALFILGQSIHMWAYQYKQAFIIRYTPLLPIYFPTTSHSTMNRLERDYPEWVPAPIEKPVEQRDDLLAENNEGGLFNYPRQAMSCEAQAPRYNVLFVVLESWQQGMLNAEVTPNMYRFSRDHWRFNNHYSGGSVTVTGMFSLMYGLQPNYMSLAQSAPLKYQTMLTKTLAQNGYQVRSYTQSNLDRFNMKQMFFGNIADSDYFNPGGQIAATDERVVDKLTQDIRTQTEQPWFKLAFLTSSHHNYDYPPETAVFKPIADNSEGFLFDKQVDAAPYLNDYKNALYYLDSLFARIEQSLAQSGQLDNTLIVLTGDHGEEFNENGEGYWGHGSNFTKYQSGTPLVVAIPNRKGREIAMRSGHIDIVPTVLEQALGCDNADYRYSSGASLLELPANRGLEIRSYKNKAYLLGERIYTSGLSLQSYNVNDIKQQYQDIEYDKINALRKELQVFSK